MEIAVYSDVFAVGGLALALKVQGRAAPLMVSQLEVKVDNAFDYQLTSAYDLRSEA